MARKLADLFGGRFFKAEDFPRPAKLVIKKIADEELGRDKEQKVVARFRGEEKALVLNKVNAEAICEIADTDDLDETVGTEVVLFATTTDFGGRTVDCIRVRAPKDRKSKAAADKLAAAHQQNAGADDDNDDDIPF